MLLLPKVPPSWSWSYICMYVCTFKVYNRGNYMYMVYLHTYTRYGRREHRRFSGFSPERDQAVVALLTRALICVDVDLLGANFSLGSGGYFGQGSRSVGFEFFCVRKLVERKRKELECSGGRERKSWGLSLPSRACRNTVYQFPDSLPPSFNTHLTDYP